MKNKLWAYRILTFIVAISLTFGLVGPAQAKGQYTHALRQAESRFPETAKSLLATWWGELFSKNDDLSHQTSDNEYHSIANANVEVSGQNFSGLNTGYSNQDGVAELQLVTQYPMLGITVIGINQNNDTAEYNYIFAAEDSVSEFKISNWWWRFKWFCDIGDLFCIFDQYPDTSIHVWVRYIDGHLEPKNCAEPNIGRNQKLVVCQLTYPGSDPDSGGDPDPGGNPAPTSTWAVGDLVGLCKGTHIYEGPGGSYPYHTIVPEDNWTVKIIGGPQSFGSDLWWNTSRAAAGDPSGGTGWVEQGEAEFCSSEGEIPDTISPVIIPKEIWPDGKGNISIVVRITDNSGQIMQASLSGGPGTLSIPLSPRPDFGEDLYAAVFTSIPKNAIVNFTIVAMDYSNNVQVYQGSSRSPMGGQFGVSRCKDASAYPTCSATPNVSDASIGDPVTLAEIIFIQRLILLTMAGPGESDIDFEIVYNAQDSHAGIFGQGWSGPYQSYIRIHNNLLLKGAEVVYPDGQVVLFPQQGDGSFAPSTPGNFDRLEQAGGTYILTKSTGQQFVFDSAGPLKAIRDPNGNEIRLSYDGDRLVRIENDGGRWVSLGYNGEGKVITLDGPEGKHIELGYTGAALTSYQDLRGQTWTFEYEARVLGTLLDVDGQPYEAVDYLMTGLKKPDGQYLVKNTYNEKSEVVEQWIGGREHRTFGRDESARITTVTDAYGKAIQYIYDEQQRLIRVEYPDNTYETFGYDDNFNRTSWRDRKGNEWTYTYDARGNRLTEDGPLGWRQAWEYAPDFNKPVRVEVKIDDHTARVWTFEYDSAGNPIEFCNLYHCSTITYNGRGLPTSVTDFAGNVTTNSYDSEWDLASTTNGENETATFTTDAAGRTVGMHTPLGYAYTFTFDVGDKLTDVNGPLGYHLGYEYDANGDLEAEIDPNGGTTRYAHDQAGNIVTVTNQNNVVVAAYTYGDMNEVTGYADGEGRSWTYENDIFQRVTAVHGPLDTNVYFKYDALGNVLETTDAEGRVTKIEYNELNYPVTVTRNYRDGVDAADTNLVTSNEYDLAGDLLRSIDPMNNAATYTYDLTGQMLSVTNAEGQTTSVEYDAMGNIVRITSPRGFDTVLTYDRAGRLKTVQDALGFTTSNAYDKDGNLVETRDALGVVTRNTYNELDRLSAQTLNYKPGVDPDAATNVTTRYEYDPAGNATAVVNPLGARAEFRYDAAFRMVDSSDYAGAHTAYTYDNAGNLLSVTDANQHTTTYEFDALDRVTRITNPEGHSVQLSYNKTGALTAVVDARGYTTTYTLDGLDRVVQMLDATNGNWLYLYDRAGNILSETDANGHVTNYAYDDVYRLVSADDAAGNRAVFAWDADGNLVGATDANNNTTTFEYDPLDQLIAVTNAENETTRYTFNAVGQQEKLIEADNTVTLYGYDALQRLASVTENFKAGNVSGNDVNVVTRYAYDAASNLVTITNAKGANTLFEYDPMGRLAREVDPLGNEWKYSYDPAGNLASRLDANGNLTQYAYYPDDQLQTISYWDQTAASFTYDENNNLLTLQDSLGQSSWVYDELNRISGVQDALNRSLAFTYDAVGNRTGITYPDGNQVTYTYLDNNWLESMTSPAGTTTYDYDNVGNVRRINNPNATQSTIEYDKANRVTSIINEQLTGAAKTNSAFEYTYNQVGHVTGVTSRYATTQFTWENGVRVGWQKRGEISETYGYDGLHRLASATRSGKETGQDQNVVQVGWQMTYAYDAVGNRTRWQTNDNPFTQAPNDGLTASYYYNAANQLTSTNIDAQNHSDSALIFYNYDGNGNRIEEQHTPKSALKNTGLLSIKYNKKGTRLSKLIIAKDGVRSGTDYSYDPENRLTAAQEYQVGGGKRVDHALTSLAYDGLGRRLVQTYDPKTGGGGAKQTEYTFDGLDPLAEYSTWDGQSADYYRGAMGRISVMQTYPAGTEGQMYWYDYNFKGDVAGLSKQDGQSIHNYQYDPYGGVIYENGNFTDPHNHYTLTGKEYDENTGLVYFGARFYDPQTAQWMTQDSYRGENKSPITLYRYAYTNDNPVTFYDPDGHAIAIGVLLAVAAGAVVGGGIERVVSSIINAPAVTERQSTPPTSSDLTNWLVDRMNENSGAPITQAIRNNWTSQNPIKVKRALQSFVSLVRQGAVWDYKGDILGIIDPGGCTTLGGKQVNFQAVANINFGFVAAKIGFPATIAESGAGIYQIIDNWGKSKGNIGPISTWFDDPADNYWIKFGYSYGKSTNGKFAPGDFTSFLNDYITNHGKPPEPLSRGN